MGADVVKVIYVLEKVFGWFKVKQRQINLLFFAGKRQINLVQSEKVLRVVQSKTLVIKGGPKRNLLFFSRGNVACWIRTREITVSLTSSFAPTRPLFQIFNSEYLHFFSLTPPEVRNPLQSWAPRLFQAGRLLIFHTNRNHATPRLDSKSFQKQIVEHPASERARWRRRCGRRSSGGLWRRRRSASMACVRASTPCCRN